MRAAAIRARRRTSTDPARSPPTRLGRRPSAGTRLRGSEQPLNKIPSTVEIGHGGRLDDRSRHRQLVATLARQTPGINLSDSQGNYNRVDVTYRGFTASPVQGVPQGLAVYQNGVRINEAFGDVVNFDLIPPQAIQRIDVVTGNPVFGLNALGGAVNIQMKNGFTWQGTEIAAWGGSDARTAGYLQYGKIVGQLELLLHGRRPERPRLALREPEHDRPALRRSRLPLAGLGVPPDRSGRPQLLRCRRRDPGGLHPRRSAGDLHLPADQTTEVGTLQLTGRVDISPTWDLAGNAYFRRFSETYVDGNDGNFENCSSRSSFRGFLCYQDDGFSPLRPASRSNAFRNQFLILGQQNQRIPFRANVPYGTIDTTLTEATGYGGSLQAANRDRIFGLPNTFVVGGSVDAADFSFKSSSTLGVINPNLSITTDPNNPYYGTIPGLGTPHAPDAGALGIAPSSVNGSNVYLGLYTLDTLDVTDRLSLTAGSGSTSRASRARI